MRRDNWKKLATEGWAFVLIAVIAFVGGFLVGDLGSSPKTETVLATAPAEPAEGGEAESEEAEGEAEAEGGSAENGAQLFTSIGCGSCHTLAAAGTTGTTGPDLEESLATDDNTAGIEVMITEPDAEIVEGYPANVMPQDYGESLSKSEIHELAEFLVANTEAMP